MVNSLHPNRRAVESEGEGAPRTESGTLRVRAFEIAYSSEYGNFVAGESAPRIRWVSGTRSRRGAYRSHP